MEPHALELSGVRRRFGRLEILKGVDLTVGRGQVVALLGPNGAGKTTLMRIVARLLRPQSGKVRVMGLDMRADPEDALARLGFLSHQPFLYEALTAEENVTFFARLYGMEEPRAKARQSLERVGLEPSRFGRVVGELSRGLRQRVALARSVVHGPSLLILDEPFSGLDPQAAEVLLGVLREHREGGGSGLISTHDLARAHTVADRVAVLARGRMAWSAATTEVGPAELEQAYARAVEPN